ncbi:MAG TPA: deoxyribonuclease V [Anaerolineae bacterium]|jgi:deoxyribonuclease V|nr:deoxyribonuclease V [Anaerolineae bacterium]
MKVLELHPWHVSAHEAADIQRTLRAKVRQTPIDRGQIKYVAGADVSYSRGSDDIYAAVVVLSYPDLHVVEEKVAVRTSPFPYIPGFLSFREGPAVLAAFQKVTITPDVIIFDGQGVAHPRGLGIASHMGLLLDRPSIGCAKSVLVGTYDEPGTERGSWSPLSKGEEQIGVALRTRAAVSPVFVSVGHRIDIWGAIEVVLTCAPRYRLPEPIRKAHLLSNTARAGRFS